MFRVSQLATFACVFSLSMEANALFFGCPSGDTSGNWMNPVTSESYTYQEYRDNPTQNISGDALALDFRALAVVSDGNVQAGDQVRVAVNNGALFADADYRLEEDLGGAGTGDLTVANPPSGLGTNTLTFDLNPANFNPIGVPFSAPVVPCDPLGPTTGEGVILTGSTVGGQPSNFTFASEPWAAPNVELTFSYLRGGSVLFSGTRVLFTASDWEPIPEPVSALPLINLLALGGLLGVLGVWSTRKHEYRKT